MSTPINNAAATGFLKDVRHPLLALHREILDASRAQHESEFGPVSPGEFLQIVINGSAYRWIAPLSTLIAAIDDVLDDAEATSDARIEMALAVSAMFGSKDQKSRNAVFDAQYLPMLQTSPEIAVANGQVVRRVQALVSGV